MDQFVVLELDITRMGDTSRTAHIFDSCEAAHNFYHEDEGFRSGPYRVESVRSGPYVSRGENK